MKLEKQNIPFTMVANEVLIRSDISLKAKGLFAYLFSKPDGWDYSADRMASEMKEERKTIQSILNELKHAGLLERNRQSNGRMEYILKYSDTQSPKNGLGLTKPKVENVSEANRLRGNSGPISNKDNTSNKDIATSVAREFNFDEYLHQMENHKARHVQVIAFYFKKKNLKFDTLPTAQAAIKRHLRAARELAKFPDDQIVKAYKIADREYPKMYTVETLFKILTK